MVTRAGSDDDIVRIRLREKKLTYLLGVVSIRLNVLSKP